MKCLVILLLATFSLTASNFVNPNLKIINGFDSVLLNLSTATLSAQSLDVAVSFKSDDIVNSFDFAFQFTTTKITFNTAVAVPQGTNGVSFSTFFNQTDLYLRGTINSLAALPNNQPILIIQFLLSAPCISLSTVDFYNLSGIINGTISASGIRSLNLSSYYPVTGFTNTPICLNEPSIFTSISTVPIGSIQNYQWLFSNNFTDARPNTTQTFSSTAVFSATLNTCSNIGCCNKSQQTFTVFPSAVISITSARNCTTDTVSFSFTNLLLQTPVQSYAWTFGDNNFSQATAPTHKYAHNGSFKVLLSLKDNFGCRQNTSTIIMVHPADINRNGVSNVDDFLLFAPQYELECND